MWALDARRVEALLCLSRYLNKVDAAVAAAKQATDGPITIVAHSAGGWLSRVYLLVISREPCLPLHSFSGLKIGFTLFSACMKF